MGKVYFVYVDWTLEPKQRAFYVGKGTTTRIGRKRRNPYWVNIANKFGWHRQVLVATRDEQYAYELERKLIAEYKTFENGDPNRWGANLTEGGEGATGLCGSLNPFFNKKHTPEVLEANRRWHLGRKRTPKQIQATTLPGDSNPMSLVSIAKRHNVSLEEAKKLTPKSSGEKNGMYNRKHTPVALVKIVRGLSGEHGPHAKLTWSSVNLIRTMYVTKQWTLKQLADKFNVTFPTIHKIVTFKTWKPEHNEVSA